MNYDPHSELTDPARPNSELWRLAAGLMMGVLVYYGLNWAIFALVALGAGDEAYMDFMQVVREGETPLAVLVQLYSFGCLGAAVMIVTAHMHNRPARGLLGPLPRAVRDFTRVFVGLALLYAVVTLLPPWTPAHDLELNLPVTAWLMMLPLAIPAVLVQVGSEELLFRGYLQQQLGARFANPLAWIGLPSLLFGALHFAPGVYGENALLIALWAALFGAAAADLTARSGSLGPAIGLHLFNNLGAILVTALPGPMSGLALFVVEHGPQAAELLRRTIPVDFAMLLVSWLTARLALRR